MAINVEVDQVIESDTPFDVTLSVDDGEKQGKFMVTLTVKGGTRKFSLQLGSLASTPSALFQIVRVRDQNTWTVLNWGTGAVGDRVAVTLTEVAPGTRTGSDHGVIAA